MPNILEDPVLIKLAEKHKKSTAQVILRYLTQKDIVVIPKSINPQRLRQNFEIFDFKLDADDIKAMEGLDKGAKGRIFHHSFLHPK